MLDDVALRIIFCGQQRRDPYFGVYFIRWPWEPVFIQHIVAQDYALRPGDNAIQFRWERRRWELIEEIVRIGVVAPPELNLFAEGKSRHFAFDHGKHYLVGYFDGCGAACAVMADQSQF